MKLTNPFIVLPRSELSYWSKQLSTFIAVAGGGGAGRAHHHHRTTTATAVQQQWRDGPLLVLVHSPLSTTTQHHRSGATIRVNLFLGEFLQYAILCPYLLVLNLNDGKMETYKRCK